MQDVEKLKELLDKYYHKELDVETATKELGWTEEYFYKVYRDYIEEKWQETWQAEQRSFT